MDDFIKNPVTMSELLIWKRCDSRNPRTNRSLKIGNRRGIHFYKSRTYQYLHKSYYDIFPNGYDIFDSCDERDPISLQYYYKIIDSKKVLLIDNMDNLIIYKEMDLNCKFFVRCLEKDSLSYLKNFNITKHPVSQLEIPEGVFAMVDSKETVVKDSLTVKERALQVFQIFTNISIFIDYNLFVNLSKNKILKLNYELEDFYYKNLSIDQRKLLDKNNGKQIFKLKNDDLEEMGEDEIKFYLLDQIEQVLKCDDKETKFMANYIILGGLSLVIIEVKELYENFSFTF